MPISPINPELLVRHASGVQRLALRLVVGVDRAEDVSQEVLLAALEAKEPPRGRLHAWLRGVTRNVAASTRRRDRRQAKRHLAAETAGTPSEPADVAARLEDERLLTEAVSSLEEPYRAAIYWRYYAGLMPREIAEQTGTPIGTVKTHLRRGLTRLRAQLEGTHRNRVGGWRAGLLPFLPRDLLARGAVADAGTGFGAGTWLLAAVLVVSIVSATVALWPDADDAGEDARSSQAADTGDSSPRPRLVGRGHRSDTVLPDDVDRRTADGASPDGVREKTPSRDTSPTCPAPAHAMVTGRILDPEGKPLGNVQVTLYSEDPSSDLTCMDRVLARTRSDADGAYRLGVDAGTFPIRKKGGLYAEVVATDSTYVMALVQLYLYFEAAVDGTVLQEGIDLHFRHPFTLRCSVVDESGRAVDGARCLLASRGTALRWPDGRVVSATTDSQGEAALRLPLLPLWVNGHMGPPMLLVLRDGYARSGAHAPLPRATPGGPTERTLRVVLRAPTTLSLRLRDPDGAPVADEALSLFAYTKDYGTLIAYGEDLDAPIRTDAQGRVPLPDVPAGLWTLEFSFAGSRSDVAVLARTGGAEVEVVSARLAPTTLRYVDARDDAPLVITSYTVRSVRAGHAHSGSGGSWPSLSMSHLQVGPHEVTVGLGGRVKPFKHSFEASPDRGELRIRVPALDGLGLRGRVLNAQGVGVADATVDIDRLGTDVVQPEGQTGERPPLATAEGDDEGHFRFSGLEAGSYRLVVWHEKYVRAEHDVELRTDGTHDAIRVRLSRGGTIHIVFPSAPQSATWHYEVQDRRPLIPEMLVPTTRETRLVRIPPGETALVLETSSFWTIPFAGDPYAQSVRIEKEETISVDFSRARAVTAEGTVYDEAGAPLRGQELCLRRIGPDIDLGAILRKYTRRSKHVFTDGQGRFVATGLLPGRYAIPNLRRGGVPLSFEVGEDGARDLVLGRSSDR